MADYTSPWLVQAVWGGQPSTTFTYTDGGVFQNEPLGMAKNLVEALPGGRLNAYERGYLYIAPKQKGSTQVKNSSDRAIGFDAATADYKVLAGRLADSVVGQSEFQDWSVAEGFNDKLKLLNKGADQLQSLFLNGTLTAASTSPVSTALLGALFSEREERVPPVDANVDAARDRLRKQYKLEYDRFADAATANAWLDAVLVLEYAGGLHKKEEMLIYDFVANPELLASTGLMAFVGFFDVRYRKHDYDYGRKRVQDLLKIYKGQDNSIFAKLTWTPKPIDPIDQSLNGVQIDQVDEEEREKVCDQIKHAANDLLKELDTPILARPFIDLYIDGQIRKLLAL
jgi:hypothetical protein